MNSRTRPHSLLAALPLMGLALTGCSKEEPKVESQQYADLSASIYCEAAFSCACDSYPYASYNECYTDLFTAYNELLNQAAFAGMTYDGSCPQRELEGVQNLDCISYVAPPPEGICFPPCKPFFGPLQAGSPCEATAVSADIGLSFSQCAQGLTCISNVCADPCLAGNALPGLGEPCPDLICAAGGMCDLESGTCIAAQTLPGPGQPCVDGACDPLSAVCIAAANTCAALPSVGQACIEGQCDVYSYCDAANDFCVGKPPLACALLGGGVPGDGDGDPTGDGDGDPTGDGDGDGDGDTTGGVECNTEAIEFVSSPHFHSSSTSTSDHVGSCGGDADEAVLTFFPTVSGSYTFSTFDGGADFDSVIYVREGNCNGTELGCNDDFEGSLPSLVTVELVEFQEYTVIVDSIDIGGSFELAIIFNG